ncbi:sensor histidine kinase [Curtobacterium sp. MCBD17_028]|uniref:sensor histidine kinase n=1 Tax=Curtobacterium sp. MCBD17_028 TaxID=2175670 RepID=UPI000DA7DC71|nr:histidine kinase [Curtobacterium sp. MCBD17_028]PZE23899.1 hypothetical protein DEI86_13730 [Curtobacterium sp. MCBD17_028]
MRRPTETGRRRFARVGRVLPVAALQLVGTLVLSRWTGPTPGTVPAHPGPPWGPGTGEAVVAAPGPLAIAMLVAAVVVLPFRWRWPVVVLGVTLATTLGYAVLVSPRGPFVAALTMAAVNAWLSGRRRSASAAVAIGAFALPWVDLATGRSSVLPWGTVTVMLAWGGLTIALSELARVRVLRAAEARRARAEAVRRRAEDERVRIARELHDSVAHNMSLINLQAGVALHLGADLPDPTRAALTSIRDASHEALVELRAVLGVLRRVDDPDAGTNSGGAGAATGSGIEATGDGGVVVPERSPVPGLDRLRDLVLRAEAAGLDVTLDVDGDLGAVDRIVDRTAFRIVQESVTNVMKHAPWNRVAVVVGASAEVLDVTVEDLPDARGRRGTAAQPDPAASAASAASSASASVDAPQDTLDRAQADLGPSGNGIIGMRERVAAVGGVLEAGPVTGGGWRVHARLPTTGTTTTTTTTTTTGTGTDISDRRTAALERGQEAHRG